LELLIDLAEPIIDHICALDNIGIHAAVIKAWEKQQNMKNSESSTFVISPKIPEVDPDKVESATIGQSISTKRNLDGGEDAYASTQSMEEIQTGLDMEAITVLR
jgi:hypothetical protein